MTAKRRPFVLIATLCILVSTALQIGPITRAAADDADPDYWKTLQAVSLRLKGTDIGALAMAPVPPNAMTDVNEAAQRFIILILAGYEDKAAEFLPVLKTHLDPISNWESQLQFPEFQNLPPGLELRISQTHFLENLIYLLSERERPELARRLMEAFPNFSPSIGSNLLVDWLKTQSPEQLDAWLVKQAASNPGYYSSLRFNLAQRLNRQPALVEEYRRRLEASPGDHDLAMQLARGFRNTKEMPGIEWLADVYKPASASAAYEVGYALSSSGSTQYELALRLLLQARSIPHSPADDSYVKKVRRVMQSGNFENDFTAEKDLRIRIVSAQLRVYQEMGKSDEAEKILGEIPPNSPVRQPVFNTRRVNGVNVIEDRKPGTENENSPEYCLERYRYYKDLKEFDKALEAARKAISLTSPAKEEKTPQGKGGNREERERFYAVKAAAECLLQLNKVEESFELWRQELAAWPPRHPMTERIASELAGISDNKEIYRLQPDDKVFWKWMTEGTSWALLSGMAKNLKPGPDTTAFWDRAETIAGKDPERLLDLSRVMLNHQQIPRGLKCLKIAHSLLPPGEKRMAAAEMLYTDYLSKKDWKSASAFLPELQPDNAVLYRDSLTRLDDLYECAAKSGARQEAMKFWVQARNRDRWTRNSPQTLVRHGMKPRIIAYYEALLKKEPDCTIAREQLAAIRSAQADD